MNSSVGCADGVHAVVCPRHRDTLQGRADLHDQDAAADADRTTRYRAGGFDAGTPRRNCRECRRDINRRSARVLRKDRRGGFPGTCHLHRAADGSGVPIIRDGPLLGALFESFVTLSVRVLAQAAEARTFHLRTQGGRHEIDLIVESARGVVGIEVKLAPSVRDEDVAHLHWLREQIGQDCTDLVVITTGAEAYRRSDGVAVVPLALPGP